MTAMRHPFLASAAIVAFAGGLGLAAGYTGLAHGWSVFAGIAALLAWIAFERLSRR